MLSAFTADVVWTTVAFLTYVVLVIGFIYALFVLTAPGRRHKHEPDPAYLDNQSSNPTRGAS